MRAWTPTRTWWTRRYGVSRRRRCDRRWAGTPATDRARAAGAEITADLHVTDYGSRDFAARDPEGNRWSFGTYPGAPR